MACVLLPPPPGSVAAARSPIRRAHGAALRVEHADQRQHEWQCHSKHPAIGSSPRPRLGEGANARKRRPSNKGPHLSGRVRATARMPRPHSRQSPQCLRPSSSVRAPVRARCSSLDRRQATTMSTSMVVVATASRFRRALRGRARERTSAPTTASRMRRRHSRVTRQRTESAWWRNDWHCRRRPQRRRSKRPPRRGSR